MKISAMIGAAIHADFQIACAASRVSPANTAICSSPVSPFNAIFEKRLSESSVNIGSVSASENGRCGEWCGCAAVACG